VLRSTLAGVEIVGAEDVVEGGRHDYTLYASRVDAAGRG